MSNPAPTPIKDDTPVVNEAELNKFPSWQRALRRKQLEAAAHNAIQAQKNAAAEAEKKAKRIKQLLDALAKVGIEIPDTAKVNTADTEPVISHGGYNWSFNDHINNFGAQVHIEKPVPEALTVAELDAIDEFWADVGNYYLAVTSNVSFNPVAIANALDDLDQMAQERSIANIPALAAIKAAAADVGTMPALSANLSAAGEGQTRTAQRYETFALNTEGAAALQDLLDDGWSIAFEQFLYTDGVEHCVRLEKEVTEPAPTPEKIKADAEADTDAELSKFDEALLEIIGDDDDPAEEPAQVEPEPVGAFASTPGDSPSPMEKGRSAVSTRRGGEVIYHVDEPTDSALDTLLAGKPIAQSIAKHGMAATRQAMNAEIARKVFGDDDDTHYEPLTSLSERIKAMRVLSATIEVQS